MKSPFSTRLLQWNLKENSRKMPWKGEKDPYKIWLSEIILQQTRVEQGWAYYEKFIKAFPTINHLAKAPEEKVFKLWEGLGYYSRCKNLIATAHIVVDKYNGIFPAEYDQIKELKGIGPYTAAAIASFAFNKPHAVVDGNVQRVLARYFGITTAIDSTEGKKLFSSLAEALLPPKQAAIYNQAIMDFGAVICKPQNPLCEICIQKKDCEALRHGQVKNLPVKAKAIKKKVRWFYYFLIVSKTDVLIRKRTSKDIWQNLHEFVLQESPEPIKESIERSSLLKEVLGKNSYTVYSISKLFKQKLTHQDINGYFIVVHTKQLSAFGDYIPVKKKNLSEIAFPAFINQFLHEQPDF